MKIRNYKLTITKVIKKLLHNRKLNIALVLLLIVFAALTYLLTRPKTAEICRTQMQKLDESAINLPADAQPLKSFTAKDSGGNEYEIKVDGNTQASTTINLNSNNPSSLTYEVTVPEEIKLVSEGGYVAVKKESEPIAMFRVPQGVDNDGFRIDYKYELQEKQNGKYQITLTPTRSWQLSCATFPVKLHAGITNVSWDEAIVRVGRNSDDPGTTKDGDIIDIKPAGWNWGTSERKQYAIVKIPKLTPDQIAEYTSKTITQPTEVKIKFDNYKKIPDDDPRLADRSGLVRYYIDYTKLATPDQLAAIRDPEKENPLLDANGQEVIQKKSNPDVSAIPANIRLAVKPSHNPTTLERIASAIIPVAKATGTVVKSIGTSSRDYSTITLWENGENGDLVTAQEIHKGELYNDSTFDEQVTIDGSTTNSSYYMWLSTAPGENHNGTPGTGALLAPSTLTSNDGNRANILWVLDQYTVVENMEISETAATSGTDYTRGIYFDVGSDYGTVRNNIAYRIDARTSGSDAIMVEDSTGVKFYNNMAFANTGTGLRVAFFSTASTGYIYNSTSYNNTGRGIRSDPLAAGSTITIKNNIAMGSGVVDFAYNDTSGTTTSSYNLSSDSTADDNGGSGQILNATIANQFISTTSGSEDVHLASTSDAIDAGTDTSSVVTDDIDGDKRPFNKSFDLGADEYSTGLPPVSLWHFDEGGGSTAGDSSTNKNDLTITNAAWYVDPNNRSARSTYLQFDGTGDYASRTSDNDFNFGSDSFTITGWFRHPSTISATQYLITRFGSAGWKVYMNSSGYICFGVDDDSTWTPADDACTTTSYADSSWHHFAAVKSKASSITIYLDGLQKDQDASLAAAGPLNTSSTLYVGMDSDGSSNGWVGFIDELAIYNYALTQSQINADANQGAIQFGAQNPDPLTDGLVGYWKMDESSGTNVADSSGNGNTGTAADADVGNGDGNTPPSATGSAKFGYARYFDGIDDYINAGSNSSLDDLPLNDFTVSTWINPDVCNSEIKYSIAKSGGTSHGWTINFTNSSCNPRIVVWYSTTMADYIASNNTISSGQWQQLTTVWNASTKTAKIYINGAETTYATQTPGEGSLTSDASDSLFFGYHSTQTGTRHYDGIMDETRIYNRALSPAEVQQLYEWAPGPVAYYKFDEGSGTTNIYDSSGYGNTGTMNGSMTESDWVTGKYGKSLNFDGSNDYISGGSASNLDDLDKSSDFTAMAWVKIPKSLPDGYYTILQKGNATATGWRLRYRATTDRFEGHVFTDTTDGALLDSFAAEDNQWHHVAMVYDDNGDRNISIYVDGVKNTATPTTATGTVGSDATDNLLVGSLEAATDYFSGSVDEVKIYNYVRTQSQIIQDMNAGHPAPGSPVGSPLIWYKFDEGYGDTAHNTGSQGSLIDGDLAGSGTTCPQTGDSACPTWTNNSKFDKALVFDTSGTTDDYVDLGQSSALDLTSAITISAWINTTTTGSGTILGKWDNTNSELSYRLMINRAGNTNKVTFAGSNNGVNETDADGTSDINDGSWHHVLGTYDGSQLKIYVDGKEEKSTPLSTGLFSAPSENVYIGAAREGSLTNYFNGSIDEVKIYNFALTPDQVKAEYNQGKATVFGSLSTENGSPSNSASSGYCPPGNTEGNCAAGQDPSPFWEMKLDEGSGTTFHDTSGNGRDASLNLFNSPEYGFRAGKMNYGYYANGSSSSNSVRIVSDNTYSPPAIITMEAWVYPTNTHSFQTYAITKMNSNGYRLDLSGSSSPLNIRFRSFWTTNGTWTVDSVVPMNKWSHVAVTYDTSSTSNVPSIYLNGVLQTLSSTTQPTGTWTNTTDNLVIFEDTGAGTTPFFGVLDNIVWYNYIRTPAQIAWDYDKGAPVAEWKLDECSGSTAHDTAPKPDRSSTAYDGTIYALTGNSVGICNGTSGDMWADGTNGKHSSSLSFDGTDDYVDVGTSISALMPTNAVSVSAWIKLQGNGAGSFPGIVSTAGAADGNKGYFLIYNPASGKIRFYIYNSGSSSFVYAASNDAISTGTWYHLTGVYDGTNVNLYVNGVKQASTATATSIEYTGVTIVTTIGVYARDYTTPNTFQGQIDDARIYNYGLTSAQVKTLYNQGAVHFGD